MNPPVNRRSFLAKTLGGAGLLLLSGCDALSGSHWFPRILGGAERLSRGAQNLLTSQKSMAQEFSEAEVSPNFRSNGTAMPNSVEYESLARNGFRDWTLEVGGLVQTPARFGLLELRQMPSRTQITRHDCVEGWSAIGKWTGVPLHEVLTRVQPMRGARYVVFYCADPMESDGSDKYYESIDMEDAYHPQTILAYELNGQTLPIANGAPIRVRVERQLGYKMAKYVMRIELVESISHIGGGKGGYWEDQGYEWYAGI